jgi:hypothetical protein
LIQTVEGDRVTSEQVMHFNDGSVYDEITVYSEDKEFRLISDHLKQYGKSFPKPVDIFFDATNGNIKVSSRRGNKTENEEHHLNVPDDVSDGLITTLVRNLSPSTPETTVSMVTESDSPRLVKLKIHSEGEQEFLASGYPRKAIHWVVHIDIGGVAGAVASVVGKQPPDLHVWEDASRVPTFVRFEGQLYEEGPIWIIDLAATRWNQYKTHPKTGKGNSD